MVGGCSWPAPARGYEYWLCRVLGSPGDRGGRQVPLSCTWYLLTLEVSSAGLGAPAVLAPAPLCSSCDANICCTPFFEILDLLTVLYKSILRLYDWATESEFWPFNSTVFIIICSFLVTFLIWKHFLNNMIISSTTYRGFTNCFDYSLTCALFTVFK